MAILEAFIIGIGAGLGSGIGSYLSTKYANHRLDGLVEKVTTMHKEMVVLWKKMP